MKSLSNHRFVEQYKELILTNQSYLFYFPLPNLKNNRCSSTVLTTFFNNYILDMTGSVQIEVFKKLLEEVGNQKLLAQLEIFLHSSIQVLPVPLHQPVQSAYQNEIEKRVELNQPKNIENLLPIKTQEFTGIVLGLFHNNHFYYPSELEIFAKEYRYLNVHTVIFDTLLEILRYEYN